MSKPELLKAATEWKMLMPMASGIGRVRAKEIRLSSAPSPSNSRVVAKMLRTNCTIPRPESRFMASRTRLRPRRLTRRPISRMMPAPTAVTPRPPIWISAPRMNCPTGVKVSPASTAISPVTQTALVEVYSASM